MTLQKIKLAFVGLAAMMVFYPSLSSPGSASSDMPTARAVAGRVGLAGNPNLILFKRGALDTRARRDLDTSSSDLLAARGQVSSASLSPKKLTRVIQFRGPIRRAELDRLQSSGLEVIGYVPNNAYLIRGGERQMARAAKLDAGEQADEARPVRWMGRLEPVQKLAPAFDDEMLAYGGAQGVDVEVELVDSPESAEAIAHINAAALSVNREPRRFLNFIVLSVRVPVEQLLAIAGHDEVLFVDSAPRFATDDERGAQIVAGNLTADGTQPASPGYTAWLAAKGLDEPSDFVIDITDTGLDRGSTSESQLHPDFLDNQGRSRVAYFINYTADGPDDRRGHGSLVASVAGGSSNTHRADSAGYRFGIGVDPAARLGASRIFDQAGRVPIQLSFTTVASNAYQAGARITNNSWGNGGNSYDATAQEYDALVRDARPVVAGNQEMTFVFSAGNNGASGHIGSPGTAKNVITVGASENFRPEGFDSCNLDGQGPVGPDDANSALDILRFSSGGPTGDGRAKPDITAPGTHVYGVASQAPLFNGVGLCAGAPVFQPPDQTFYTWSSGTSFAAPHIAGAAALTRRFFTRRNLLPNNAAPSPAMIKAYLVNSASYMTGENAGGDLPADRQGWGRVDLSRAFDAAARAFVDQTTLFTESGQSHEIRGAVADRSKPLRVTLAWTDAPGSLAGVAAVNDLDLEIKVGGATVYRGNNFAGASSIEGGEADRLNNVESIFLPAGLIPEGVAGNFTITVRAANIAGDGVPGNATNPDQDFALVVYNIGPAVEEPPPPPPKKTPVITTATYVKKRLTISGREFTAAAQVEINGQIINRAFEFAAGANSLSIKLKRRKLNLNEGADNSIVLIEKNERSAPFILRL